MLIVQLLQQKMISPRELYLALNRKGHSNRDKDGGLGKVFHQKTRQKIVSEAFDIDDKNKTVALRDLRKLVELGERFKKGIQTPKNDNKYAICLALICHFVSLDDQVIINQATSELETLYRKGGCLKDKDGLIAKLIIEKRKSKLAEVKPIAIQAIELAKLKEEKPIFHIAQIEQPIQEEKIPESKPQETKPQELTESLQLTLNPEQKPTLPSTHSDNPLATTDAPEEIIIQLEELPNLDNLEQKPAEAPHPDINQDKTSIKYDVSYTIRKFLVDMNSQTPDDYTVTQMKVFQTRFFCKRLQNFDIEELKYLCQLMSEVQSGQNSSLHFAIIRRDECGLSAHGNTEAWQKIYHAAKQMLITKLKNLFSTPQHERIKLDKQEYENFITLLNNHTGRWYATLWGKTRSCVDFENSFEPDERIKKLPL